MGLQENIRNWIKEAWSEANESAPLTPEDRTFLFSLSEAATKQVQRMRDSGSMTWMEAWSEIAPEFLSSQQPSVAAKAQETM